MPYVKAKVHRIRFLVSVRFSLGWSLTLRQLAEAAVRGRFDGVRV